MKKYAYSLTNNIFTVLKASLPRQIVIKNVFKWFIIIKVNVFFFVLKIVSVFIVIFILHLVELVKLVASSPTR